MNNKPLRIDLETILAKKAGRKAHLIPRFVVNYLKKIVHQEEINDFLRSAGDRTGVEFIESFMEYFHNGFEIEGIENLPSEGLCTFVSNHPLGAQDGLGLTMILGQHYGGNIRFLVNDILMNIPPLSSLFLPVNIVGHQSRNLPSQVNTAFASDSHIVMFPAGICSRSHKGEIRDLAWKKTFIVKSVQSGRMVVPIHFYGRNSNFFYRIANLNKLLPVKFNFAMLFLSDEMFKNRNKIFKVKIGKPIPWQTFDKSRTPSQWAGYVEDIVYRL